MGQADHRVMSEYTGKNLLRDLETLHDGSPTQAAPTSDDEPRILTDSIGGSIRTKLTALLTWLKNKVNSKEDKLIEVTVSISAASTAGDIGTASDSRITSTMKLIRYYVADSSYQTSEWTITTGTGTVTVNGTASAATTVTLILGEV